MSTRGRAYILLAATLVPAAGFSQRPRENSTFKGHVFNSVDSSAVRNASIRLMPIDSTPISSNANGVLGEIFVDSSGARFGVSDSLGAFAINDLDFSRRYLFQVRRLGFAPQEGILNPDSSLADVRIPMTPTSQVLAAMTVTETSVDRNGRYLQSVGFTFRQRGGFTGHFLTAADVTRHNWLRADDLLLWENLKYNPTVEVRVDGIRVRRTDAMNFPAYLIVAVEVYQHMRPIEFDANGLSSNGPLVLIWTFRP